MKVFRIAKEEYVKDLTGTGAKLFGGRWNPKGTAILYTAENKSLAALEVLVHFNRNTIPDDLRILTIKLPDHNVLDFATDKFKKIFSNDNSHYKFQSEGKLWVESKSSLGLKVPSVLMPGEYNILVNPLYKNFNLVEIEKIEVFKFDKRFFI